MATSLCLQQKGYGTGWHRIDRAGNWHQGTHFTGHYHGEPFCNRDLAVNTSLSLHVKFRHNTFAVRSRPYWTSMRIDYVISFFFFLLIVYYRGAPN